MMQIFCGYFTNPFVVSAPLAHEAVSSSRKRDVSGQFVAPVGAPPRKAS